MSDPTHTHGATDKPNVSRERSDVNARGILLTAGALVVIGVVIHLAAWWLLVVLDRRRQASSPPPLPWAKQRSGQLPLPPPPRLEGIDGMQGDEVVPPHLPRPPESYATVDGKAGIVQIPLERAMRLIVEHDLLKTEAGSGIRPASGGMPSDANSGRGSQIGEP